VLLLKSGDASNKNAAHPHQGKLKPFSHGPPAVSISNSDKAKLDEGEMIVRQTKDAGSASGRALAIQTIHAPPHIVWGQLLDFSSYNRKVDKLAEVRATCFPHYFNLIYIFSQPYQVQLLFGLIKI